jgi:hypothetical protein
MMMKGKQTGANVQQYRQQQRGAACFNDSFQQQLFSLNGSLVTTPVHPKRARHPKL